MDFHPLANLFPLMEGAEFDALVADIREHGLREAVIVHEDMILDGRNRYRACEAANVEPIFQPWHEEGTALAFVVSKNLNRRHLNASQRSMVATKLANMKQGERTDIEPSANLRNVSQSEAAKQLNVSERAVQLAKVVLDKAAPEIREAVERGEVSVAAAAEVAHLPKKRQAEIVKGGKKAVAEKAKELRANKRSKREREASPEKQQESDHDRDLRYLRDTWDHACETARIAFATEKGFQIRAVA